MHQVALYTKAVDLLKELISIPSFSREEQGTADAIVRSFEGNGVPVQRHKNNIWAANKHYDPSKPTILLNSHHDTVRPNKDYTRDPFMPAEEQGMLYGLGSNDAGGCLVALIATFLHFYDRADLQYNIIVAATAEEEISGVDGIAAVLPLLGDVAFAIVGEPTRMNMAVAEKGLMVLDCVAHGVSGHAARDEGDNAIYKAMKDIEWFRTYAFPLVSELLGPVKMSVTMVNAGTQHNVVPATCSFTVDVRLNECYDHESALATIRQHVTSEVSARSTRLRSTSIAMDHPLVVAGLALGLAPFGSATMSDKALMPFPALKIGPGDSARSHTADEYILLSEIRNGIDVYIQLLNAVL
jgi:acetylornithine deacetylase